MKIGLQVIQYDWPGSPDNIRAKLAEISKAADEAGFDSIWVMDHLLQMDIPSIGYQPEQPMLDGYSALCYLAAVTQRPRLGAMVTSVSSRQPGHLLKIITALDVLSGGRANLGIGAGWYEREALGLGLDFPPLGERFERLEETLQLLNRVWSGDFSPFEGQYYRLAEPINSPQSLSKPHPPILIGGSGEKKTLRLVAQYGDACNMLASIGNEELARKLDVLKLHCDDVGRDYAEIEKTALAQLNLGANGMSSGELVDMCRGLADTGFDTLIFSLADVHELTPMETIGRDVIPAVDDF